MSIDVNYEIHNSLRDWNWERAARIFGARCGMIVGAALRFEAPGTKYPDSIIYAQHTTPRALQIVWTGDAPLSDWIIKGTAAHEIDAIPASDGSRHSLHWTSATQGDVFAMSVQHPGTKPNNFPQRTWDKLQEAVQIAFKEAVRGEIDLGGL